MVANAFKSLDVGGAADIPSIIAGITADLGNNTWQGISNAVLVRDFSSGSSDLAPFLNVVSGEWDIPDRFSVIVDTTVQSFESIVERVVNALGDLIIQPSLPGGVKGMSMTTGAGSNAYAIQNTTGGLTLIGDVSMVSDDVGREYYNISGGGAFSYSGLFGGVARPGTIDSRTIVFDGVSFNLNQFPYTIGATCQFFRIRNSDVPTGFIGINSDLFDLTSTPSLGNRIIDAQNCSGRPATLNDAIFLIGADNGLTKGTFDNCEMDAAGSGTWIRSDSTPEFNSNPEKSVNFNFEVLNFVVTQRAAEVGIVAGATTTINASNTLVDINGTFILDSNSTSGFDVGSVGQIINKLPTPATYVFQFNISGNKTGGGTSDFQIKPSFKPFGSSYSLIQVSDGSNSEDVRARTEYTAGADPASMTISFTQRFTNVDDEVKVQIENLNDADDFVTESLQFIATRIA